MEALYPLLEFLTAGVVLAFGVSGLLRFVHKNEDKANAVFSSLCFCAVACLLVPDRFNVNEFASAASAIKFKQLFNLLFVGLLPWYIALYTGDTRKLLPAVLTALVVVCCVCLFLSGTINAIQFAIVLSGITLFITIAVGFYAAYKQSCNGKKAKAHWLFAALGVFAVVCLFGAANYFMDRQVVQGFEAVLKSINLGAVVFLLIVGSQQHFNSSRQPELEKIIAIQQARWQSLLDNLQLMVLQTDLEGKLTYTNPYGVNLLNYKDASEIIHSNWSDHCSKPRELDSARMETGRLSSPVFGKMSNRSSVLTRGGKEKLISWTVEPLYNDAGTLVGNMHIGVDITDQEEAVRQVYQLKTELEKESLAQEPQIPAGINEDTIGKSRPFMYAIQKSRQVAPTNASVLLLGETGVGKECFANLIQQTSHRSNMPFVKVNCGALPADLIEDELFGHEKGAFTGAINSRMGRFEKANGGTIFLDEIGELPLVLQPKLLRVLQNGEFERVGGHHTIKVDVRIIAATNNDLEKEVKENRFREDLFYRLNVFPITIPPLRKRNADIVLLIQNFIERKSKEHGKHFETISKADMNRLCDYEWPGNIRQLKNVIERAVISSEGNILKLDWFYEDIENGAPPAATASLEEMETAYIVKVLQECRWKINGDNGAAEKLALHPNTLRSRMKKLNINVPWKQES